MNIMLTYNSLINIFSLYNNNKSKNNFESCSKNDQAINTVDLN